MPTTPESELITVDEMADRLSMSRKQFTRLVRLHRLPKVKIGHKTVRFAPEAVIAIITEKFTT